MKRAISFITPPSLARFARSSALCASFGAMLALAGCGSHSYTMAGGGWQALSIDGNEVERAACDFDKGTVKLTGLVNYAGAQKAVKVGHATLSCNNAKRQVEWTVQTGSGDKAAQ